MSVLDESYNPSSTVYESGETVVNTWTRDFLEIWAVEIAAKTGDLESVFRFHDENGNTVDQRNTTTVTMMWDRGQLDFSSFSGRSITKVELIVDNTGATASGDPGPSRLIANAGSTTSTTGERTVVEAREIVRASSLISGNVSFENERVDRAIQAALRFAIRVTESNWIGTSVSISSRTEDFSALIDSRFRADRFGGAWIADRPVHEVSMRQMFRFHYYGARETGQPRKIAFFEDDEAHFFPEPDKTYNLKLWWREPLVDWVPGSSGSGVVLNVPNEWVDQALWWGAASMLVHGDPQTPNIEKARAWKIFLQVLNQFRNTDDPIIGPVEPDAGQLS